MSFHLKMVCTAIAGKGKMSAKWLDATTTTAHTSGFTLSVWDYHSRLDLSTGTALIADKLYHCIDLKLLGTVLSFMCIYTTRLPKLVSAALTVSNLSTVAAFSPPFLFISDTGIQDCKIVYRFFRTPITHSTWMRALERHCDVSTSLWESWLSLW